MRLVNKTDIPDCVIRDVVRFARPRGIKRFRVTVAASREHYRGFGCANGIDLWVGTENVYPRRLWTYQIGQLKGRRYYLGSEVELLIYLVAHELAHTRQGQRGRCRGRPWGARGRFSELEAEVYAIRKLREWRRGG